MSEHADDDPATPVLAESLMTWDRAIAVAPNLSGATNLGQFDPAGRQAASE